MVPLLVPSTIGAAPYRRMLGPPLSERFRILHVDLPGGDPERLTFDLLADHLEAARGASGADRVAVLGHSMLGILALEYARRYPRSVSHVVLAGTPPSGDFMALLARARTFFEEDAEPERKAILRASLAALPAGATPAQTVFAQTSMRFFDPAVDAAALYEGAISRPELLQHLMGRLIAGWDVTVGADSLTVPILVAHGRRDYAVPWISWEGIPPRLPDATFQLFERSSHHVFWEEPEAFADAVHDWMAL